MTEHTTALRYTAPGIDAAAVTMMDSVDAPTTSGSGERVTSDENASYGIDAPGIVAVFGLGGLAFVAVGIVLAVGTGITAGVGPWVAALFCLAAASYMVRSSKVAKRELWVQQLDDLELRGNERALDVGCGRGLVAVELAKRLPKGEVIGIDIWRSRDQSGNNRANAERNVELEGVGDRVEIQDADMTELPFPDASFDIVTASLALHSLPLAAERGDAMKEIMRVTKPGGRVVILDNGKTVEYQAWLNDAGWDDIARTNPSLRCYPPVRSVTAVKPQTSKPGNATR